MTTKSNRTIQKGLSFFILVLTVLTIVCPTVYADNEQNDVLLEKDTWHWYNLYSDDGDEVEIEFSVRSGDSVDVYILTKNEYERYSNDSNFNPARSWTGVKTINENWIQPDDREYRLVIDNWDNAKTDDTVPTGDVRYDLFFDDKLDEKIEEILGVAIGALAACCIVVIIIGIVVIWLIVRKKKTDTVIIQPAMGPQGYQPQQPRYQQGPPMGQPPQQPPQYQPGPPQQPPQQPPQYQPGPPMGQPVQPVQPPQYQPPPMGPTPPPMPPQGPPMTQTYTPPTPPPIPQQQYKERPPNE